MEMMDIITVATNKFQRRSKKMTAITPKVKTAYLNNTHSTRLEWIN